MATSPASKGGRGSNQYRAQGAPTGPHPLSRRAAAADTARAVQDVQDHQAWGWCGERLGYMPSPDVVAEVAAEPGLDRETAAYIVGFAIMSEPRFGDRAAVALWNNPDVQPDIQQLLLAQNSAVRHRAANREDLPAEHLALVADLTVREPEKTARNVGTARRLAKNPSLPPAAFAQIADRYMDSATVEAILRNPSCPPDILTRAAQTSRSVKTMQFVASNPNTPPEVLAEIALSGTWDNIRQAAADNPNCPEHVRVAVAFMK